MDIPKFFSKGLGSTKKPSERKGSSSDSDEASPPKRPSTSLLAESPSISNYDIAQALSIKKERQLTRQELYDFATKLYIPPPDYRFPPIEQGKRKRYFQHGWLLNEPHLAYSRAKNALFCSTCVLFGPAATSNRLSSYASDEGSQDAKSFLEKWNYHKSSSEHQFATESRANFLKNFEAGSSVVDRMSAAGQSAKDRAREHASLILTALQFISIHGLPSRGHRDSGKIESDTYVKEEDLFRNLVRLMGKCGHPGFAHLLEADDNATYVSPQVQNELLDIMADKVRSNIVQHVHKCGVYSLLADEWSEHGEQFFAVGIRTLVDTQPKELIVKLNGITNTTGEALATEMLRTLHELGLPLSGLVAQAYDGAANMSGPFKGLATRIKTEAPMADYVHCAFHRLNLAVNDASAIPAVATAVRTLADAILFVKKSPKRSKELEALTEELGFEKVEFVQLNPTRFVARHTSVLRYLSKFVPFSAYLQQLAASNDDISGAAEELLERITSFKHIFSLHVLAKVAAVLESVSISLQSSTLDIVSAFDEIRITKEQLQALLSAEGFNEVFDAAVKLAMDAGVPVEIPRPWRRANVDVDVKELFEMKLHVPYVQAVLDALDARFGSGQLDVLKLQLLIPSQITVGNRLIDDDILQLAFKYRSLFVDPYSDVKIALDKWNRKWAGVETANRPANVIDALKLFETSPALKVAHPIPFKLLTVLAVVPASTATIERSFSLAGRIFSDLRSTMTGERLDHLLILATYPEETSSLDLNSIFSRWFDKSGRRMLNFVEA